MNSKSFYSVAVVLFMNANLFGIKAFHVTRPQPSTAPLLASSSLVQLRSSNDENSDPTKVWYAGFADAVQNLLTNSPLNEGKKAVVKALAGDYDKAVVSAKLDALVSDTPVLMLSFVK